MNKKLIYILIINLLLAFPDCDFGTPNWEDAYQTIPFDNEFSASLPAVQIFIDGLEQ